MSKIKLFNESVFDIEDYATSNRFSISSEKLEDVFSIIAEMTDENLSEIQFLTDEGEVNGIYHDNTLKQCVIETVVGGYSLTISLVSVETATVADYQEALRDMGVEV